MPYNEMPSLIDPLGDPNNLYNDQKYVSAVALDTWGQPGAIGWARNMRFGTGIGLLDFCLHLQVHMHVMRLKFSHCSPR